MTLPINPMLDRNPNDVAIAAANKDLAEVYKGSLSYEDLNRIETNCQYIEQQLNRHGYYVYLITKTDWAVTDFPTRGEIDRIRRNVSKLIACYAQMPGSPDIRFWDSLDWQDVNSLEQNLANIDTLLQWMMAGFRRCGGFNFYSGGGMILP